MDELDGSAGPEAILQSILELSVAHFDCQVAAVSLPHLGIQQTHPAAILVNPDTAKPIISTLDCLNAAASKHKKILVSDKKLNGQFPR